MSGDYQAIVDQYLGAAPETNPDMFNTDLPIPQKVAGASVTKQNDVATTAWEKIGEAARQSAQTQAPPINGYNLAIMKSTGAGLDTASPIERDYITLDPVDFSARYGDAAREQYDAAFFSGDASRRVDTQSTRTPMQILGDTANTVLSTPVQILGSIGAFGAGAVSDSAGVKASQALSDFTEVTHSLQSPQMQAARRVFGAEQALHERDNTALAGQDIQSGAGDLEIGFNKVSRDTVDAIRSLGGNSPMVGDTVVNAAGSLLAGGALSKGLGAIGSAVLRAGGISTEAGIAAKAVYVAARAKMPASIAAMEGGSAYQQTADRAMRELADQTDLTQAQKEHLANQAAIEAGALQGGVTAGLMTLPGFNKVFNAGFERNPFAPHSVRNALKQIGGQTLEEGFQEGSAQVAENKGIQDYINPNQNLTDQVGQNIALGAIGGLGSAATAQAPGIVAKAPIDAFSGIVNKFTGQNKASQGVPDVPSTPSAPNIAPASQEAPVAKTRATDTEGFPIPDRGPGNIGTRATDTSLPPRTAEQQTQYDEAVAMVQELYNIPDTRLAKALTERDFQANVKWELAKNGFDQNILHQPPHVAETAQTTEPDAAPPVAEPTAQTTPVDTSQFENPTVSSSGKFVHEVTSETPTNKAVYAHFIPKGGDPLTLHLTIDKSTGATTLNVETYKVGADGVKNSQGLGVVKSALGDILQAYPEITKITGVRQGKDVGKPVQTISPASIDKLRGKVTDNTDLHQVASDYISKVASDPTAQISPDHVKLIDNLLFHDDNGTIQLTAPQRATLRAASALTKSVESITTEANTKYGMTNAAKTTRDIISKAGEDVGELGKNSLVQHVDAIRAAYDPNDLHSASHLLTELRFFAEHMGNKVAALNEALASGNTSSNNPVSYPSYVGGGRFRMSGRMGSDAQGNNVRERTGLWVNPSNAKSVALAQQIGLESSAVATVVNNLVKVFPDLGVEHIKVPVLNKSLAEGKQVEADNVPPVDNVPTNAAEDTTNDITAKGSDVVSGAEKQTDTSAGTDSLSQDNTGSQEAGNTSTVTESATDVGAKIVSPIKVLYPDLLGSVGDGNRFHAAFKVPSEPTSRTSGNEAPLAFIRKALNSAMASEKLIGNPLNRNLNDAVANAYRDFLGFGDDLLKVLDDRLQRFVSNKSERGITPEKALTFIEGQALHIVEKVSNGYKYNPELIQLATLAGLQWYLKLSQKSGNLTDNDVRTLLGLKVDTVLPDTLVDDINNRGIGLPELVRSLSKEIERFWGMNQNKDTPRNYAEGVLEGVAKEVIASMVEGKMLLQAEVDLTNTGLDTKLTSLTQYSLAKIADSEGNMVALTSDENLRQFPNAIETAVLTKPEEVTFIGSPPETVEKTQLRNSAVRLSRKQIKAMEKQQNTPHYINLPFISVLSSIGENLLLDLFAGGKLDPKRMNKQDMASLTGKNLTVQSAFRSIRNMLAEATGYADLKEMELGEVPIHFAYDTTVVNRQQMRGRDNPSANKLMREAVLPTWHTSDMTKGANQFRFKLGLAQALGVKVHTQSTQKSLKQLDTKLAGFTETLKLLDSKNHIFTAEDISTMKAEGLDTPAALHALIEYNRLQNADTKSKKAFKTSIYFEADGVTNGIVNAMALFSSGAFTGSWLSRMERGGLHVGEAALSLVQLRKGFTAGSEDLYSIGGTNTTLNVNKLRSMYHDNGKIMSQFNAVRDFAAEFLKDVNVRPDGGLDILRGTVKNPMTITIYGSSAKGIAGNLVDEIKGAIYAQMSKAAALKADNEKLSDAEAFYPHDDPATAQDKFDRFITNLNALTGTVLDSNNDSLFAIPSKAKPNNTKGKFTDFALLPSEIDAMRQNVLHALVNPMVEGITEAVGSDLMETLDVIKTQVQAWSLIGKAAYRKAYAEALAAKNYESKNDLLSAAEEQAVLKSVMHMLPKFTSGDLGFIFGMTQRTPFRSEFARDLLEDLNHTSAYGYSPDDAGVSSIPGMTQGAGDGQAILNMLNDPEMLDKFLQIYDGVHSSAFEMQQMGLIANRAVNNSWQKNPMKDLANAYKSFLDQLDINSVDLTDEDRLALTKSLFPTRFWGTPQTTENIMARMNKFSTDGLNMADAIDQRQAVLNQVQHSVDQMAGAESPHQKLGLILTGSNDQKAAILEKLRNQPTPQRENPSDSSGPDVNETNNNASPQSSAPAKIEASDQPTFKSASSTIFGKMLDRTIAKMTPDKLTRALLRDVLRSGAAADYTVHIGTREELTNLAADMGITLPPERAGFKGFMDPNTKSVFVVDGNPETVLHELIHAATFDTIVKFFAGEKLHPETVAAIGRLETLMNQFKEANLEGEAYQNALDAMERAGNQASELNEFMAWALANADLQAQLKETKVSPLVKLARLVVKAIKDMLFGGKRSAAVKDDMFTNIRFNTNIVMRTATIGQFLNNSILYHDPNYGDDPRIDKITDKIAKKVFDFIDNSGIYATENKEVLSHSPAIGAAVAKIFQAAGFTMTMQQHTAFVNMLAIMATNAKLNANSTVRMQELFTHVSKHLSVDDFLKNPTENNPADIEQATKKLDALLGNFKKKSDAYERSVILPAFIALAMTNDEFRAILKKIPMPKASYGDWKTVDGILDNLGDLSIDNMSRALSGEGLKTKEAQTALDGMVNEMLKTSLESKTFIDRMASPLGNGIDKLNEIVVNGITWLGKKTTEGSKYVSANTTSKLAIAVAQALDTAVNLLNDENGKASATRLMSTLNGTKLSEPIFNLLKDLIGRTDENGQIYDLIKTSRAWVHGVRQQFREELPKILNKKFLRTLTEQDQTILHQGLGQTGMAALLSSIKIEDVLHMLSNEAAHDVKMKKLMDQIRELSPKQATLIETKADQLANYMITKEVAPNLLRNATAIAHLLNEGVRTSEIVTTPTMIEAISHLVALKALRLVPDTNRAKLAELAENEPEGMNFMLSYLSGQDSIDQAKATGNAKFNHWMGHMPVENAAGLSLMVAHNNGTDKFEERSMDNLGAFLGSTKDPTKGGRGYWFSPIGTRASFAEGIIQNVHQTVSGVDQNTGFSTDLTAGQITEPDLIKRILADRTPEQGNPLMPVFDDQGQIYAFERSIDPDMLSHLNQKTNMANMMGIRSGRQSEEANANAINHTLIDALRTMYHKDVKAGRQNEYVNLSKSTDAIHRDAMAIFSHEVRSYIDARFPEGFHVRRELIDDAIGYRNASIGDVFTGNSRWSEQTQTLVKNALTKMFGNKAYRYAVTAENVIQNVMQDARTIFVVKSVIVPLSNAVSNIYQLIGRGVPLAQIFRSIPKITAEIESWHKSRIRQMEAEAELLATTDVRERRQLTAEIQTIKDSHKRLSIWPLLEAGEFSSISDAGSREDVLLSEGRMGEYLEQAANKLPPSIRTIGKYIIVAQDTALFRGLQKSVAYGDFIAKAILMNDLTVRKGQSNTQALKQITEEYVNYERLSGRDRSYLENIGLLWFYNFKIRAAKVALSMIRNNPVHTLISMALPEPINGVGFSVTDNIFSKMFNNRLGWSIGYDMGIRAPGLLPVANMIW